MSERRLAALLEKAVAGGAYSAIAGRVARGADVIWEGVAGWAEPDRPATLATRFDLASLSKPFTATLALRLDQTGQLPLGLPVGEIWPGAHRRLAAKPLEALLRHRSGLLAWTPLYADDMPDEDEIPLVLTSGRFLGAPVPTYSDLGYILWGHAVRQRLRQRSMPLLRREVLEPLGLERVEDQPRDRATLARCYAGQEKELELAALQGIEVEPLIPPHLGDPQDLNARLYRRFAGHAGLFGDLAAMHRLALAWLVPGELLEPDRVRAAWRGRGPFVLGWARPAAYRAAGTKLSARARGHLGFTGGSLWIDPASGLVAILLGHRCLALSNLTAIRRRWNELAAGLLSMKGADRGAR